MDAKTYAHERSLLIDAEREASRSYDKTLTTLSAAALALSFNYVRELQASPDCMCLLYAAWIAFGLSLLMILVSFLFSQKAIRAQRDIIDRCSENDAYNGRVISRWSHAVWCLNILSLVFLVLGVAVFGWFLASNLFRGGCNVQ